MKRIVMFFIITLLFDTVYAGGANGNLVLFSGQKMGARIEWSKCNGTRSQQFVEVDEEEKIIYWSWRNKHSDWCGWGLRLPEKNLVNYYETHSIQISWKKKSKYDRNNPPEVKFVSYRDQGSSLLKLGNRYLETNNANSKIEIFKVPLKDFYGRAKSLKNLKYIQLDAAYDSSFGEIEIVDLRFVEN
ncbi:membrane or secreted protein [Candidatus Magnetomorum sp. HK-1]|nr:membrane or secreted protein [Candidatus Magnetomorum sp. HK-1]